MILVAVDVLRFARHEGPAATGPSFFGVLVRFLRRSTTAMPLTRSYRRNRPVRAGSIGSPAIPMKLGLGSAGGDSPRSPPKPRVSGTNSTHRKKEKREDGSKEELFPSVAIERASFLRWAFGSRSGQLTDRSDTVYTRREPRPQRAAPTVSSAEFVPCCALTTGQAFGARG